MKRSLAVLPILAFAAALGLAGCSSSESQDVAQVCAPEGNASKSIEVTGKPGADLTLDTKLPISVKELERSVLIEGKGDPVVAGGVANATMSLFNGKTGALLTTEPAAFVNDPEKSVSWMIDSLGCATAGERVTAVVPAVDLFGADGAAQFGFEDVTDTDAMVLVFDVESVEPAPPAVPDAESALPRAEGDAVEAPKGFPTVKLAEDGAPTITIPKDAKAPTKLEIATLIEGDGPEVKAGADVIVHYTGVVWSTGETFDSSWDRGEPAPFNTTGVIPGFTKAIEGQKVGSQVIALIPADEGYGEGTAERIAGAKNDDVLVFVVDILASN